MIGSQVCLISVCAWLIKLGKFNVSSLYQAKHSDLLPEYLICTLKFLILELILAMHLNQLCAPVALLSNPWLAFLESQPWEPAAMGQGLGNLQGLPYLLVAWLIMSFVTLSVITFSFSLTLAFLLSLLSQNFPLEFLIKNCYLGILIHG